MTTPPKLERIAFTTSRLLDFCSTKELTAQTGHALEAWLLVVLKELLDNSLDACEDAGIAPTIRVSVDRHGIRVEDNGPGLPAHVVERVLDYEVRVSSREAYIAPDRGAQGNALKTVVAMPFVLDGSEGRIDIETQGAMHAIRMRVDRLRQKPVVERDELASPTETGTTIRVHWPAGARSLLEDAQARFLQIADDYTVLNPHLTLSVDWFGEAAVTEAIDAAWKKWKPNDPTCAHWYNAESFQRLVAAHIIHDRDSGRQRTVRELVSQFRGLTGTAKQSAVLKRAGLARVPLATLADEDELCADRIATLLEAMRHHSNAVKAMQLGPVGKKILARRFEQRQCEMKTFRYCLVQGDDPHRPWLLETAFAWQPSLESRRLVTGVNWSAKINDPFRELGQSGHSLASLLDDLWAGPDEPVCVFVHLVCVQVDYTDRGKSAVIIPH